MILILLLSHTGTVSCLFGSYDPIVLTDLMSSPPAGDGDLLCACAFQILARTLIAVEPGPLFSPLKDRPAPFLLPSATADRDCASFFARERRKDEQDREFDFPFLPPLIQRRNAAILFPQSCQLLRSLALFSFAAQSQVEGRRLFLSFFCKAWMLGCFIAVPLPGLNGWGAIPPFLPGSVRQFVSAFTSAPLFFCPHSVRVKQPVRIPPFHSRMRSNVPYLLSFPHQFVRVIFPLTPLLACVAFPFLTIFLAFGTNFFLSSSLHVVTRRVLLRVLGRNPLLKATYPC